MLFLMSQVNDHLDVSNMAPFEGTRKRFTVQRKDSAESVVSAKLENGQFFNGFICILKWISAVLIFLAVLFCIVTSKLCLLVLGHQFKSAQETKTNTTAEYSAEANKQALVMMLVLALVIPQAASLLYAIWTSLRRKSRPWPTKQGFIIMLVSGALEAISLNYIAVVMVTVLPVNPDVIVLLMCSLSVAPAIWQAFKSRSQWQTCQGKLDVIKFSAAAISAITGIVMLSIKVPDLSGQIGIPVSFFLLSIAWSPKLRKLQIRSKQHSQSTLREHYVSGVSLSNNDEERGTSRGPPVKIKTARGKAAIVSSFWKLFLTPLIAMTFAKSYDIVELDSIYDTFKAMTTMNPSTTYFMLHIFASFFGYHFGWLSCSLCMQRIGYALPLTLATPITLLVMQVQRICEISTLPLPSASTDLGYILGAGFLLWFSQFIATTYYTWKSQGQIMAKASDLLWIPSYNGVCLEQYLLLNRRNQSCDEEHNKHNELSNNIHVFICTTMYHEADYEMEQLLRSIHDVDINRTKSGRHFESHVFFDGCIRANVLNSYVLQLVSLVEKTLVVSLTDCIKMKTPYGMQLRWKLQGGMDFTIHLKDNAKVKNKKRWSQVMYMSYVLDFRQELLRVEDDQCFILTTDADVKFTHWSVEALIDQITEDPKTGAVCARTHPLGDGPVVWYQIFDYAIGHWFQKVANHMLGSVLCSPGCFSLYRCQAVRDVLPTYSTGVDHAFEFLTKDMGEDRWMCTLMIQRGWRLTYCAAAEDSTYCPESFDEFYKQRRRWTPSTLANLVLLVSEWKRTLKNNEHISFLFILYQTFLVCSTVIGPSTVILVIVGGMVFSGLAINEITTVALLSLLVLAYILVCLFASQNVQLKAAKILTFVFAVIMCIVIIGVAVQISNELKERRAEPTVGPTLEPNTTLSPTPKPLEHYLPAGVSTLYLAGLSSIFLASALLHPKEFTCLLHGIWYILCLPSGYLLLTIYSLCNLTDRSWGTREGKSTSSDGDDWYRPFWNCLKRVCKCCQYQEESEQIRPKHHGTKDGSIIEGRTNITVELSNSSSKLTRLSDANENTGVALDTEESVSEKDKTNVPRLSVMDTYRAKDGVPSAKSEKRSANGSQLESHKQSSVFEDDCVQKVSEIYRDVMYSAAEIPRKKRARSSKSSPSNVAAMNANENSTFHKQPSGQSSEPATTLNKDIKDEVIPSTSNPQTGNKENITNENRISVQEAWADDCEGKMAPIDEEDNFERMSKEYDVCNRSIQDFPTCLNKTQPSRASLKTISVSRNPSKLVLPAIPRRTPPKPTENPQIKQTCIQKSQHEVPVIFSTQIESSQSITVDSSEYQLEISSRSHTSQAELPVPTEGEISRPGSALEKVSHSDPNSPVEDWIPNDLKDYAPNFRKNGYEKAKFIAGMTDQDLERIGIQNIGHRQKLMRDIKNIPRIDIEENIPEDVEVWLQEHGLEEYWPLFRSNGYAEPSDLVDLKKMSTEELKETLLIRKPGHLNRLKSLINKLQYPNRGQMKIRRTRNELDGLPLKFLDVDNSDGGDEYNFWNGLRQECLIPEMSAFDQTSELKGKLVELRNTTLLVFGVSNALWMIIILALVRHKDLKILGVDIIGLGFLTIYGGIFAVQFLALLCHRFKTLIHILARAPWKMNSTKVAPAESPRSQQTS